MKAHQENMTTRLVETKDIYIYIFLKALMTKSIVFRTTSVKMEEAENQTTKS